MIAHNCVRNPDTGACYTCNAPMLANSMLNAIIAATEDPRQAKPINRNACACGAILKPSETQCTDCWIAEQTRQPAPQPKPVKQTKPVRTVTLDSVLSAMAEDNPNKWN